MEIKVKYQNGKYYVSVDGYVDCVDETNAIALFKEVSKLLIKENGKN